MSEKPDLEVLAQLERESSPAPWRWGLSRETEPADVVRVFTENYEISRALTGEGRVHSVCIPVDAETPIEEAGLYVCYTGNGPTSERNAQLIAAVRDALPWFLEHARTCCELATDEEIDRQLRAEGVDVDTFALQVRTVVETALALRRALDRAEAAEAERDTAISRLNETRVHVTELADERDRLRRDLDDVLVRESDAAEEHSQQSAALAAERDRLRAALDKFARHRPGFCAAWATPNAPCTCGLVAALADTQATP